MPDNAKIDNLRNHVERCFNNLKHLNHSANRFNQMAWRCLPWSMPYPCFGKSECRFALVPGPSARGGHHVTIVQQDHTQGPENLTWFDSGALLRSSATGF